MGSPPIISPRPLAPEPVSPMSVQRSAVICDGGEVCIVERRRLDSDDGNLPPAVARIVVLDVVVPALDAWGSLRLEVSDDVTVPLFRDAVSGGGCPHWSCPTEGCRFQHMRATNRGLAVQALAEHLDRWHHHAGVAA